MELTDKPVVGLITAPVDDGPAIARAIVDRKLAACVNVVPSVQSIYWWDGEVQDDTETLLIVKTIAAAIPALNEALEAIHPYDTFELVVVDIDGGNPPYLDWIKATGQH
jgi:periplasmic divalent cation tolerance protein